MRAYRRDENRDENVGNPARAARPVRGGPAAPGSVAAILAMQRAAGNRAVCAAIQREADEHAAGQRVRAVLGAGGEPVEPAFRARAESFLGADLSHVRVHTGAAAARSARSVRARAYTSGADIVFDHGSYDTTSAAGQGRLVHELTHVVQQQRGPVAGTATAGGLSVSDPSDVFEREAQRSAEAFVAGADGARRTSTSVARAPVGPPPVQRDVGFEFETKYLLCRKMKDGTPVPDAVRYPEGKNDNEWDSYIKSRSERLRKAAKYLKHPDFTVEADDRGSESSCEIVTAHFPLTDGGIERLHRALDAMVALEQRLVAQGNEHNAAASDVRGDLELLDHSVFFNRLAQPWGFKGAPQMTMGLGLKDIPTFVSDLLAHPGEREEDRDQRQAGRAIVRSAPESTMKNSSAAKGLVLGAGLARQAIAAYQHTNPAAPASPELTGLLTLIYSIPETVRLGSVSLFLKQSSDLLAKTDYATLFKRLPTAEREYYRSVDGVSLRRSKAPRFVDLVASAPGYGAGRIDEPVFATDRHLIDEARLDEPLWYRKLTMRQWLTAMSSGWNKLRVRDLLRTEHFPDLPRGKTLEGFGVLGSKMDTNPIDDERLPIMEFRSFNRLTTIVDARPELIALAEYVRSLNENRRAPIVAAAPAHAP